MKIRMPKRLLLIIVLAAAAAGLAYLIIGLVYVPELAQFEATGELARTEYRAGAWITVEPFLTYSGMRRVTICSAIPLLFVDVYDAEGTRVLETPALRIDICLFHTLRPNVPYNEKERWPYPNGVLPAHYANLYMFRLEEAGSYRVVVRAEFRLDKDDPASGSRVCSEPIWVQITG
jgi:hypothetical protein